MSFRNLKRVAGWFFLIPVAGLYSGCTAAHYRKSADRDVYKIIEQAEQGIFGKTNAFTIETPYSDRKPGDIQPAELIGDRLETNQPVLLTLDKALDLAVNSSRRYQAEKERLYLTALSLTGARHEFSPQFFAGTTLQGNRSSSGDIFGQADSRVGVGQLLKTGGSIGVNIANDLLRYYTGDPRRSAVSAISVNLVQPLLRGAGSDIAAENLTQAERNVIYGIRSYSFFQDSFAVEIVNDYFNLLEQKDTVRNQYANYLSRVASSKRLQARAVDREVASQVDQARQAELSAKNTYINAIANYRNTLDQFKITLGLPVGMEVRLDDSVLKELSETGLIPVYLDPEQGYRIAVEHQMEILNAVDQFEDSKRKIKVAANRLKAQLNIFGDASLQSEGPTDYTNFDPNKVRADVGISLDLPLDRLVERNNYRATLVSFESAVRSLTLTLDQLRDDIERGMRTLEQRRQNFQIQKNALELANRRVRGESLRLEAGLGTARDLLEAQDAQVAAQNNLTFALVAYQEARLQLLLDLGVLETDEGSFWLKPQLTKYLKIPSTARPAEAPAAPEEREVVPPEQVFGGALQ